MYISCTNRVIELLRCEMELCARRKQGNLLDPEVLAISQALDVLLVARQKQRSNV